MTRPPEEFSQQSPELLTAFSPDLAAALRPLFDALPLQAAMPRLVEHGSQPAAEVALVRELVASPALRGRPALMAGLWLYVDELDKSHAVSQGLHDATGSYWHGVMHRREGDFSNSHYWFRQAGHHPAMDRVAGGYDAHDFVDQVQAASRRGPAPEALLTLQRQEWMTLFTWCATHA